MSGTEETRAAQKARTGLRIDAIASGFVGAVALAVSTYNVYLQREQIRAQVWPHLEWSYSEHYSGDEPHFDFNVENTGVGPALVKSVEFTVDGKPAKTWDEVIALERKSDPEFERLCAAPDRKIGIEHMGLASRVLGAGVQIHPLGLQGVRESDAPVLRRLFDHLGGHICYCSTLDECWLRGVRVSACTKSAVEFEE